MSRLDRTNSFSLVLTASLLTYTLAISPVHAASSAESQDEMPYFPPAVSVTNINEGASLNRDVQPRIIIKGRNIKSSTIFLNGSPYPPGSPVTTEGTHTLEIAVEDDKGATASIKRSFTIDKTPPLTSLTASSSIRDDSLLTFVTSKATIKAEASDQGQAPSGVASTECQVDGGRWQPYSEPIALNNLKEGTHSITCRSTDRAGNIEEERRFAFSLSDSPPTTVVRLSSPYRTLRDGSFMASPSTTFSLFASGSRVGITSTHYQVDSGPWQPSAPFSITAEGKHVVCVKSVDRLGNEETPKCANVLIDKDPPMTRLKTGENAFTKANEILHVAPSTIFSLVPASDAIEASKIEYRIDNREWMPFEPFSITEEGRHLIEYRSTDDIGNIEKTRQQVVVVDAAPPLTVASIAGNNIEPGTTVYTTGNSTVTFTADDFLSGVKTLEFRSDGGKWQTGSSFQLKKNSHNIEYRSIDNVGNAEDVKIFTVKIDSAPPVSTIETSGTSTTIKGVLHITEKTLLNVKATDSVSGVAKSEYRIDDGGWKESAAPFTVETPGKHRVEVRSTDVVGNKEEPKIFEFVTDANAPITIVSVAGRKGFNSGTIYASSKAPLVLSVHSPGWGAKSTEYRVDGGEWNKYKTPFSIHDPGKHTLEFKSVDKGGNEETVRLVDVVIDDTPPVSTISVGIPSKEIEGTIEIEPGTLLTPSATDNMAGILRTEYQIKGQGIERDGVPFSIASKGTYEISHWSIDRAGNREKPRKIVVMVTNAPKQFNQEDIKHSQEIAAPPAEENVQVAQHIEEKVQEPPPPLPDPPPDPEIPVRPPPEKKSPLVRWTVNFLQTVLIIGVMLF